MSPRSPVNFARWGARCGNSRTRDRRRSRLDSRASGSNIQQIANAGKSPAQDPSQGSVEGVCSLACSRSKCGWDSRVACTSTGEANEPTRWPNRAPQSLSSAPTECVRRSWAGSSFRACCVRRRRVRPQALIHLLLSTPRPDELGRTTGVTAAGTTGAGRWLLRSECRNLMRRLRRSPSSIGVPDESCPLDLTACGVPDIRDDNGPMRVKGGDADRLKSDSCS